MLWMKSEKWRQRRQRRGQSVTVHVHRGEREREVFSNCSLGARWIDTPLLRSHQQVTYFTLCLKIKNCWCVWWAPSCAASSHAPTFKNHFVYKGGSWRCVRPTEKLLFRHESVSESDRKWGVCLFGKCCLFVCSSVRGGTEGSHVLW